MNGTDASLIRAIRGPITLITVGVLFALNNFTPYQFHQTWPVLLIVFGLLSLMRRGATPPPPPYAQPYPQAAPPYNPPPAGPGAGSYRQSPYPEPVASAGPSKGGFGSSAPSTNPPRPDDPNQNPGGMK
jgi:hypothetical protein